jgi:site-specific DNA-methyltransferase (adenine-specific)
MSEATAPKREQLVIPGTAPAFDLAEAIAEIVVHRPAFVNRENTVTLYHDNCLDVLARLPAESVDVVFADPPYFLSNGGSTCRGGKRASVDKGGWDQAKVVTAELAKKATKRVRRETLAALATSQMHAFNRLWLVACKRVLKPNGTLWVCGTQHNIHSCGFALQELAFRLLNDITWEKVAPPPNLACRTFTHATETLVWASRDREAKHHYAYKDMKAENGGKQMKSVWHFDRPRGVELEHGAYPTQKPLALLRRVLRASLHYGGTVLDPFMGSGTAGVVTHEMGGVYIGIDQSAEAVALARARICGAAAAPSTVEETAP